MESKSIFETKAKNIDGFDVQVTVFPGLYGLKIKGKLLRFVGPALGKAVSAIKQNKSGLSNILDADIDFGAIGEAVAALVSNIDDNIINLFLELLSNTSVDGQDVKKETIDLKFAAKYTSLYKVLLYVIEVNCFFGQRNIGELFAGAPNKIPKTRQSAKD
jgi:hypothetical protein